MHALELREARFRLEKALAALDDDPAKEVVEQQIVDLQAICPHDHFDEDPAKGWRCRDCGLTRDPEPLPESDDEPAAAGTPTAA